MIQTTALSLGTLGIAGGVARLWTLGTTVSAIKQQLTDHILLEDKKSDALAKAVAEVSRKLPNGNLEQILEKLAEMEARVCGGEHLHPYRKDTSPDRRKR